MENNTLTLVIVFALVALICIPLWIKTSKPLYRYFRRKNSVSGRDRFTKSSLSIDVQKRSDAIYYMLIYYVATFSIACFAIVYLFILLGIIDAPQK